MAGATAQKPRFEHLFTICGVALGRRLTAKCRHTHHQNTNKLKAFHLTTPISVGYQSEDYHEKFASYEDSEHYDNSEKLPLVALNYH